MIYIYIYIYIYHLESHSNNFKIIGIYWNLRIPVLDFRGKSHETPRQLGGAWQRRWRINTGGAELSGEMLADQPCSGVVEWGEVSPVFFKGNWWHFKGNSMKFSKFQWFKGCCLGEFWWDISTNSGILVRNQSILWDFLTGNEQVYGNLRWRLSLNWSTPDPAMLARLACESLL